MAATRSTNLQVGSREARRKQIAILLGAPLTEQNYERTGIPYLSAHFEVVTIDCLAWLGRLTDEIPEHRNRWGRVVRVASAAEFERAISEARPSYAIDFIGRGPLTAVIQRILAGANVKFVVQKTGSLPRPGLLERLRFLLDRPRALLVSSEASASVPALSRGRLSRLLELVARPRGLLDSKNALHPDICLLAGRSSLDDFTRRSRRIIWIASQDAHLYARAKAASRFGEPSYILFVDDYLPHASDWKLLGLRPPVTAERYYASMRRFLGELEAHLGLPVVIAAHPSSHHDKDLSVNFGGRRVVLGQTPQLVLGSRLVLLHASTAVSFAVLDEKPTVFLTSDELEQVGYGLAIKAMAKSLGGPMLNIDSRGTAGKLPAVQSINRRKYARYVHRYLRTSEATETEAWQAFVEFVRRDSAAVTNQGE